MFIFVGVQIGWDLYVFFSLLEMPLGYFLRSNIFLWFLISWLIIFLLFFGLFLSLLVWLLIPYLRGFISFELGLLFFFLVCTRLGVYTVMVAGWSSTLKL